MVLHASLFHGGGGQVLGDVDQDAGLVGADLVDENGRGVAEDDMAVVGHGQLRVDQLQAVESAPHLGRLLDVALPELGCIAVGDQRQRAEVVIWFSLRRRLDTQDAVGV